MFAVVIASLHLYRHQPCIRQVGNAHYVIKSMGLARHCIYPEASALYYVIQGGTIFFSRSTILHVCHARGFLSVLGASASDCSAFRFRFETAGALSVSYVILGTQSATSLVAGRELADGRVT